jgi:4-amino-4-deoxy-L-arabinose transferase-like glycosyltransferase
MKSKPFSISKHLPVLLLLFFLGFFAHLGNMPLFDADEGSYSEVSREMLVDQDFTSVLLNDMPFFHKPPLFFWAQAASINILGLNEFALRLPSAIAALLWAASIFLFTRRCYDTRTAWHAALFMGASLLVTIVGRTATPEALLNLFLTLTLLNIYSFYRTGNRRHIYWSFMFAALGVLTKGSIAILLPVGISLIFFGMKKRWKDLLLLFFNPVGLVVFGLIVIPWYLGEFMLHGEAFLSDLLMLPGMETPEYNFIGSSLPYYVYPVFIFIGLLPFSAVLIKAVFHIGRQLPDDLIKFMLLWFLLAFLFLPLAQPKSLISVATCLPPLFIIMARVADLFRHSINLFIWPLVFIALLLLAPYLAPYFTGWIGNEFVRNAVSEGMVFFDSSYTMILGAVALLLAVLPFIKPVPASLKYGVMGLLFVSVLHFLVLPIMANILQQPIKSAGLLAKKEHLDVVTWKIVSPSFNVYAERLTEERVPQAGDTVLTKSAYLENALPYETLFEKQGVILVKILENPADDG